MTNFEDAEFWDYVVFDENGKMAGVEENMPQRAWPDYKAFLEEQRIAKGLNMKV